jgi:hypothetical protein
MLTVAEDYGGDYLQDICEAALIELGARRLSTTRTTRRPRTATGTPVARPR